MKKILFNTTSEIRVSIGLLLLRLGFGLTMAFSHGIPKLMGYAEKREGFPDPLGVGNETSLVLVIFAEVFCSFLLVLGFLSRAATIPLIICMMVAVWVIHGGDPFIRKELGLMYTYVYLVLLMLGPGKYSLDAKIAEKV